MIDQNTSWHGQVDLKPQALACLIADKDPSLAGVAEHLAGLYLSYQELFNIRADLAWAQMCHETDYLRYTGIVPKKSNNFAGIGATGEKNPDGTYKYNRFETPELGVIAHFAHIAWYVSPVHLHPVFCSKVYDPRHFEVGGHPHRYTGEKLGELVGWAVPGLTYTRKIAQIANTIYGRPYSAVEKAKNVLLETIRKLKPVGSWSYIAIHHSVSDQYRTTAKMIDSWHRARGFKMIGYNYVVRGDGTIEEGRPLNMAGAHVRGFNAKAIGIVFTGDFRFDQLTEEQKLAGLKLCKALMLMYNISIDHILGHREFPKQATLCPGPNIDMRIFRNELAGE